MCQRRQNSWRFALRYGVRKFSGRSKPRIAAEPIAMSE
jgi:hypothetical protein